jgi:hypothetical protein
MHQAVASKPIYEASHAPIPIARGQYVQFALVAMITVGVFTLFFYLAGFAIGRRWPMRPKRSLERAIHPRFRDEPREKWLRPDS